MAPKRSYTAVAEEEQHLAKIRRRSSEGPDLASQTLTISLGGGVDQYTFHVHESNLKQHSLYFKALFRNGRKEMETGTLRLEEDDCPAWAMFFKFVYTGYVHSTPKPQADVQSIEAGQESRAGHAKAAAIDTVSAGSAEEIIEELENLEKAWKVGDKLTSTTFKDATIDAICQALNLLRQANHFAIALYVNAYTQTASANALRKLAVDVAIFDWKAEDFVNVEAAKYGDFLKDVAIAQAEGGRGKGVKVAPYKAPGCTYHEHVEDGTPCYRDLFNYG